MSTPLNSHIKGDTWLGLDLTINLNASPLDLTGARIDMHIKKNFNSPYAAAEWSTEDDSILIVDPEDGHFTVEPRILDLDIGIYYYDIQITLPSEEVRTIVQGTWEITYDVTRV